MYSPSAPSPLQPACHHHTTSQDHTQHQRQSKPLLAVRHSLGISIYQLQPPEHSGAPRASLTPVWYIPAVMEVVALHWSLFLPGQLLYTCKNLCTFALQLDSASSSSRSAPDSTPKEQLGNCSEARAKKDGPHAQPRLVVVPVSMSLSSKPEDDTGIPVTQPARDFGQVWNHSYILVRVVEGAVYILFITISGGLVQIVLVSRAFLFLVESSISLLSVLLNGASSRAQGGQNHLHLT